MISFSKRGRRIRGIIILTITMMFIVRTGYAVPNCAVSDKQKRDIADAVKAHQVAQVKIIEDIIGQPKLATDQACLGDLMALDTSVFVINPLDIYGAIYDKLMAQLIAMACAAVSQSWNDSIAAVNGSVVLPFGLGGISVTPTSGNWGEASEASLELPQADLDNYSSTIETIGVSGKSIPPSEVIGGGGALSPPTWTKTPDALTDDNVKKPLEDRFY